MLPTSEIIEDMISLINHSLKPSGCTAIRGFDTKALPIPLKKTYLSFVPEKHTVSYFNNENEEFCQKSEATIRMTCFSPLNSLSSATHIMLEEVLKNLNEEYITEISGYTIGETEYDSEVKAFRITCRIFYERERCPADSSINSSITDPHNFFCKTHVKDTDIHITAKEHAKYNEPFVTGTYVGIGYDIDLEIELGFKPKFVIVFRVGAIPTGFNGEWLRLKNYCGMAIAGHSTKNIKIISNGFRVEDPYPTNAENEAMLNMEDTVYAYIAFK